MKDSKRQKIARQYCNAMLDIDRRRQVYEPHTSDCIGRIATALVQLYEIFEDYEPNLERMTVAALAQFGRTRGNADVGELFSYIKNLPMISGDYIQSYTADGRGQLRATRSAVIRSRYSSVLVVPPAGLEPAVVSPMCPARDRPFSRRLCLPIPPRRRAAVFRPQSCRTRPL